MEGARWNWTTGCIEESLPREMFCPMPVICCRAVLADKVDKTGLYNAPVYKTPDRGP
jgi:dynein heavy chain